MAEIKQNVCFPPIFMTENCQNGSVSMNAVDATWTLKWTLYVIDVFHVLERSDFVHIFLGRTIFTNVVSDAPSTNLITWDRGETLKIPKQFHSVLSS